MAFRTSPWPLEALSMAFRTSPWPLEALWPCSRALIALGTLHAQQEPLKLLKMVDPFVLAII